LSDLDYFSHFTPYGPASRTSAPGTIRPMKKSAYSLEMVDGDGDAVVRAAMLTDEEAEEIRRKIREGSFRGELHRLGQMEDPSGVPSLPWPTTGSD